SQHNSPDLYLLSLTRSCDDIFEPKLEELINQLKEVGILGSLDPGVVQDDLIILDPNSNLGIEDMDNEFQTHGDRDEGYQTETENGDGQEYDEEKEEEKEAENEDEEEDTVGRYEHEI
ncbi:unnamed protein product, partial [Thlaspi arvense]